MSENLHTESRRTNRGWTKARAVLAGGLVLGVGAAITLAAWTDNEWAVGLFGSGKFGIEGATNGTTFTDHPDSSGPAQLAFQVNADNLTPGDVVYAGYAVRLEQDSTYAADVTVTQDTTDALAGTTASYVTTPSATCDATAYGAGTDSNATAFALPTTATTKYLCFRVTADSSLAQGESGAITWQFTAVSGANL